MSATPPEGAGEWHRPGMTYEEAVAEFEARPGHAQVRADSIVFDAACAAQDAAIARMGAELPQPAPALKPNGRASNETRIEQPLPMLTPTELRAASQSIRWLVKHIIPADSVGIMFGGSGSFKSFAALDLALHVAHGLRWLGRKTIQGPVIVIAAEGGAGTWRRIHAWHRAHGLAVETIDPLLRIVTVAIDMGAEASRIREATTRTGMADPVLVIVDTMSQTYRGEENSARETANYLREIGLQIREVYRCAVLIIHHSGHAETERPRGSSALLGNCDFMLGVFRDAEQMLCTMACLKQKDSERFSDKSFSLTVESLGHDDDGEEITSLYASHIAGAEAVVAAVQHEAKRGRGGGNSLFLSLIQNGIKELDLKKAFYDDCGLDNADAKYKAYYRARAFAVKSNIIEIAAGGIIVMLSKK